MHWNLQSFQQVRLDIVGLIAVLGEGSVTRNAQVAHLSWFSILPRLLPAPQALLEHERKTRLPTQPGIVVGAYSGTVKKELNFFTILLHGASPPDYVVELVTVQRGETGPAGQRPSKSFGVAMFGTIFFLSLIGSAMSAALFALAIVYDDAFGMLSVVTLSSVSTLVGFSSHWSLAFKEPPPPKAGRSEVLPRSDVVIYYPNGAMRVIRAADEGISRLYFQAEHCEYLINDTIYRTLALFATVTLMAGVVSLANATTKVQIAFAASYVLLNVLYWGASALDPAKHHWVTAYKTDTKTLKMQTGHATLERSDTNMTTNSTTLQLKRKMKGRWLLWNEWLKPEYHKKLRDPDPSAANFTAALWGAIFLTGTSQWLNEATHIAPINAAWKDWLREADDQVHLTGDEAEAAFFQLQPTIPISTGMDKQATAIDTEAGKILIPMIWDYQAELTKALNRYRPDTQRKLLSELAEEHIDPPLQQTHHLPTVSEV